MIRLTIPHTGGCRTHYVAANGIAAVIEAGASSQWHGIRSFVKLFDGSTLECSETASEIAAQIVAEIERLDRLVMREVNDANG